MQRRKEWTWPSIAFTTMGSRGAKIRIRNVIIPEVAGDLSVSQVYVYRILRGLIELDLITKTLKGYELSPVSRKRLYRVYKALGDISG